MKERFIKYSINGITHYIKEYKEHWWSKWKVEMDGQCPRIYFNKK